MEGISLFKLLYTRQKNNMELWSISIEEIPDSLWAGILAMISDSSPTSPSAFSLHPFCVPAAIYRDRAPLPSRSLSAPNSALRSPNLPLSSQPPLVHPLSNPKHENPAHRKQLKSPQRPTTPSSLPSPNKTSPLPLSCPLPTPHAHAPPLRSAIPCVSQAGRAAVWRAVGRRRVARGVWCCTTMGGVSRRRRARGRWRVGRRGGS